MYVLKHVPEDFIVEELASLRLKPQGRFLILKVTKRNRNSEDVAQLLAQRLGVPRRAVGYAGSKDRNAVTAQYYSLERGRRDFVLQDIANHSLADLQIEPAGFMGEPLGLGTLEGNRFILTVRNLEGNEDLSLPLSIPNYFDEQRFSTHNVRIAEAIIRKDFQGALAILKESDARACADCEEFLVGHEGQFAAALLRLPKQTLRLYLHAYQSLLWNRALAKYVQRETRRIGRSLVELSYSFGQFIMPDKLTAIRNVHIPIPGFGMETDDEEILSILTQVLAEAGISQRDFVIRQLPNLSLEGAPRDALVSVKEYVPSGFEEDEHFPGKKKAILRFSLGKGSYATMVVRAILR